MTAQLSNMTINPSMMARSGKRPPRGIMFHHFHGGDYSPSQGSITADDLDRLIAAVGRGKVVSAREWCRRLLNGSLAPDYACITFDDNLRCQYDIAFPVLRRHGIEAFWFVYTSVLQGEIARLEIYRHFRHNFFDSVESFYDAFFEFLSGGPYGRMVENALAGFYPEAYLANFPFYTRRDRIFRFVRDGVLKPERYFEVMDAMIAASGMDVATAGRKLWMTSENLKTLHAQGHVVGLHSHTHPTRMSELPADAREREYRRNAGVLADILGEWPTTISHPSNSYTKDTLRILSQMGVTVGFRANMAQLDGYGPLEQPREDHVVALAAVGG